MKKFLNISLWILLFFLTPVTTLALLSTDTIPGETLYPVKRQLEKFALALASIDPETKASLQTKLVDRRFEEASTLVLKRSDDSGLDEFVFQIQTTQKSLNDLESKISKEELTQKLVASINDYQTKLTQVQVQIKTQTEQSQQVLDKSQLQQATAQPILFQEQTNETPKPISNVQSPTPTPATSLQPTPTDKQANKTPAPIPTPSSQPTPWPPAPAPEQQPSNLPPPVTTGVFVTLPSTAPFDFSLEDKEETEKTKGRKDKKEIEEKIKKTKETLEKIKEKLEEKQEKTKETQSPTQTEDLANNRQESKTPIKPPEKSKP